MVAIPAGEGTFTILCRNTVAGVELLLIWERSQGKKHDYYALANGRRIRPADPTVRNEPTASAWFGQLSRLYAAAGQSNPLPLQ